MRLLQLWLVVIYVSSLLSGSARSVTESWMDVHQAKFSQQSVIAPVTQQVVIDVENVQKPKDKSSHSHGSQDCLASSTLSIRACRHAIRRVPTDEQIFSVGHHRHYRTRAPPVIV